MLYACPEDECWNSDVVADVRFSISKDTITLKDTIWLSATLKDTNFQQGSLNGSKMSFIDGRLVGGCEILKLEKSANPSIAKDAFDLLFVQGKKERNSSFTLGWEYLDDLSEYKIKVGLIPKKKGTYMLSASDSKSDAKDGKCDFVQIIECFDEDTIGFHKFKTFGFPTSNTIRENYGGIKGRIIREYPVVVK